MKDLYKKHLRTLFSNFDKMLDKNKYDEIVLYSSEVNTIYLDDNTYDFKSDFNFIYLVPLTNYPNSFIKYKIGKKPELYLFQKENFWDCVPVKVEDFYEEHFAITYYSNLDKINKLFKSDLSKTVLLSEEQNRLSKLNFKSINDKRITSSLFKYCCF